MVKTDKPVESGIYPFLMEFYYDKGSSTKSKIQLEISKKKNMNQIREVHMDSSRAPQVNIFSRDGLLLNHSDFSCTTIYYKEDDLYKIRFESVQYNVGGSWSGPTTTVLYTNSPIEYERSIDEDKYEFRTVPGVKNEIFSHGFAQIWTTTLSLKQLKKKIIPGKYPMKIKIFYANTSSSAEFNLIIDEIEVKDKLPEAKVEKVPS